MLGTHVIRYAKYVSIDTALLDNSQWRVKARCISKSYGCPVNYCLRFLDILCFYCCRCNHRLVIARRRHQNMCSVPRHSSFDESTPDFTSSSFKVGFLHEHSDQMHSCGQQKSETQATTVSRRHHAIVHPRVFFSK